MKKHLILLGFLASIFAACTETKPPVADKGNATDVFTKVYSQEKLPTQTFTIDNSKDIVLTGKSGTQLTIAKNSFVDSKGNPVTSKVEIELKEAIHPEDIVLGNMTTTYNGQPLQTGGMIYLNARANDADLSLQAGKSIGVSIPTDSALADMSLFEGVQENGTIVWKNPVPIPEPKLKKTTSKRIRETNAILILGEVDPNGDTLFQHSEKTIAKANKIILEQGLQITRDSFLMVGGVRVDLEMKYPPRVQLTANAENAMRQKLNSGTIDEDNDVQKRVNYVFSAKLGWANIDRLHYDSRTQAVEFVTVVENKAEFASVYVALLTNSMYLPGQLKQDGTFTFSGGAAQQQFPVGAKATLIATAYKEGHPYFAMQQFTFAPVQTLSLNLQATTQEELTEELMARI